MEVVEIFPIRPDEHVAHEESMVGTSADNADLDTVLLIPSCKAVDNIDAIPGVEVVNCTFAIDSPNLSEQID